MVVAVVDKVAVWSWVGCADDEGSNGRRSCRLGASFLPAAALSFEEADRVLYNLLATRRK